MLSVKKALLQCTGSKVLTKTPKFLASGPKILVNGPKFLIRSSKV